MLFGVKAQGKGLTLKELRKLVVQLDAAGVHDDAVVRGRVAIGNKVRELNVESDERLYRITSEAVARQNGEAEPDSYFDPASIGPADPR